MVVGLRWEKSCQDKIYVCMWSMKYIELATAWRYGLCPPDIFCKVETLQPLGSVRNYKLPLFAKCIWNI